MPSEPFRILMLGDVVGKPGRQALGQAMARMREECGAHFVIANAENAAGGVGVTPEVARELLSLPIDVLTSGNHIWKYRQIENFIDQEPRLLRPANYPEGTPGRGFGVFASKEGVKVGVLNLEGQLFMGPLPCPFRAADQALEALRRETCMVVVDFHAEATSEKRAMGRYLDGRVSAVVGTHTHVPTADAEVLPGGTGYQTDLGMCGPCDSVIGVESADALRRFLTKRHSPFELARGDVQLQGALIEVDPDSGRCLSVARREWRIAG
ncbi:MAG: TIGR00282 family metallophosphoesterase [Myxococcales bacterium]|nr:TIGR00282 family metallophosphoesterase [Myxococcales bacterium]